MYPASKFGSAATIEWRATRRLLEISHVIIDARKAILSFCQDISDANSLCNWHLILFHD